MRYTRIVLSALALYAVAMGAQGALPYAPELSWTAPTQNVDGSAVPATGTLALKEYRVYCSTPPALPSKTTTPKAVILAPTQVWNPASGVFVTGSYACSLTAVNNNTAAAGNESALTNPVNFTIAAPVPLPPSVLTVQ